MSLQETAIIYQRAGLSVLPASRAQKRPALAGWKEYQAKLPTEAEISAWFANDHDSLCVVTGGVSGNLELLDFDNGGELFDRWAALVEAEAPGLMGRVVIEQSQSGGWHVIYRCTEAVCGNIHLAQRAVVAKDESPIVLAGKSYKPRRNAAGHWEIILTLVETRGEGGLFLCHPTPGYQIVQGEISDPPVLAAAEREILLEAAWSLNELIPSPVAVPTDPIAPAAGHERPGDAYNQCGDVVALLKAHGWTLARDGENQCWRRPGKTQGWSATLKGRVFYVFSSNAAPFESDRAYGPFAVYTLLEHGGDYTRAASALRSQGYGADVMPTNTTFGVQPEPLLPQPQSIMDLVAAYPQERPPLIHGLLRRGETANLVAAAKCGKSWMSLDLALAVATGGLFLGTFQCEPGRVLLIDNELHRETLAHRMPKVMAARNIGMGLVGRKIFVESLRGKLRDLPGMEGYFRSLEPGRFDLIVCDAFYRFLPSGMDENDNGAMAGLYNLIDRYAQITGSSFVLIHHTSKGDQSQKSITDVGSGAGAQSRAPDAHIALRWHEEEGCAVFQAEVRSWPQPAALCLRWQYPLWLPEPSLDPTALRSPGSRKSTASVPKTDDWTPARFAEKFISTTPHAQASILAKAQEAGLTARRAKSLLAVAEEDGLIHRWRIGPANRADFSTLPQSPKSEKTAERSVTHTPHTPLRRGEDRA